jgi:hypothetical protein
MLDGLVAKACQLGHTETLLYIVQLIAATKEDVLKHRWNLKVVNEWKRKAGVPELEITYWDEVKFAINKSRQTFIDYTAWRGEDNF